MNPIGDGCLDGKPTYTYYANSVSCISQVCKQLSALAKTKTPEQQKNLDNLREIMGVMQHHDAVSGTEKQHVANDYARRLQIGIDKCSENIQETLNQITTDKGTEHGNREADFGFDNCADLNISACTVSENSERFMVTLYNPLGHSTSQYVGIPIPDGVYEILDHENVPLASQVVPIPEQVKKLPYRQSDAISELVFLAKEIPPVGFRSFFVNKIAPRAPKIKKPFIDDPYIDEEGPFTLGNQNFNLSFDEEGLLKWAAGKDFRISLRQGFYAYKTFMGYNYQPGSRSSGAYIFRPNSSEVTKLFKNATIQVIRGELVDEVHQIFNEWISQVVRIYKNESYAEFQWLVGPVPVDDWIGREIITRFDTDIPSNGIFYTDSNGREMVKRKRNHRDSWNVKLLEEVSGNYYPVTTKIAIEDNDRRFALLTDRAEGGSSLTDGSIELMVCVNLKHLIFR